MRPAQRLGLLVASVLLTGCAPAGEPPSEMNATERAAAEEVLYEMEYEWVAAFESGDLSALQNLFADDFIYTLPDGTVQDKPSFIALNEADPIDYDSVRIENMETRWYGNTPVVIGLGINFWTEDGAVAQDAAQFTNVFEHRDGRWWVIVGHASTIQ